MRILKPEGRPHGQDLRLAFRSLRRRPAFAAAAIVTLALGIGASTAIISVAYGVSLRPLSYREPDRLIRIYEANQANGKLKEDVSIGAFHEWRVGAALIESAAHIVTDGYFQLMGIRLLDGRTFAYGDRFSEPQVNWTEKAERGVVVVSDSVARTLWPGRPAIGESLWLPDIDNVTWRDVVGVVEDVQFHGVGENPALHVYTPWTQNTTARPRLVVKTGGDAASIAAAVRDVVQRVEPGTHIDQIATLEVLVARATAQPRFTSRVVAGFGALALLLAAVGIYGTLSYLVGARTREIGIRLALGAPAAGILSNVLWRGEASRPPSLAE